jgi:hypothetical protein
MGSPREAVIAAAAERWFRGEFEERDLEAAIRAAPAAGAMSLDEALALAIAEARKAEREACLAALVAEEQRERGLAAEFRHQARRAPEVRRRLEHAEALKAAAGVIASDGRERDRKAAKVAGAPPHGKVAPRG